MKFKSLINQFEGENKSAERLAWFTTIAIVVIIIIILFLIYLNPAMIKQGLGGLGLYKIIEFFKKKFDSS